MLDENHVLFSTSDVIENARKRGDANLIRLMEERHCPIDHSYIMRKPVKDEALPEIENVQFNTSVSMVGNIQTSDPARPISGGAWHRNLYRCSICGRYFKGDWHRVIADTCGTFTIEFTEESYIRESVTEYMENHMINRELSLSDSLADAYWWLLHEKDESKRS